MRKAWVGVRSVAPSVYIALSMLLLAMVFVFFPTLSHLVLDRSSENTYMRAPYEALRLGKLRVYATDPYEENGPHAMFISAAFAYYGSFLTMRIYHFLYSLVVMAVLFVSFWMHRPIKKKTLGGPIVGAYGILFFSVWLSIPLILLYPIQFNGMTPGFLCVLAGFALLARQKIYWAMAAFGTAYSFKGQFLAFLPGLLVYLAVFDVRDQKWTLHMRKLAFAVAAFFSPTTLVLATGWGLLGAYETPADYIFYAFNGQRLFLDQIARIFHWVDLPPDVAEASRLRTAEIRTSEFGGLGLSAWAQIAFSVGFMAFHFGRALIWRASNKLGSQVDGRDRILFSLALVALPYWINYFFFWGYPFFYNTLPVLWFNVIAIPSTIWFAQQWLSNRTRYKRAGFAFLGLAAVCLGANAVRVWSKLPGWAHQSPGNALVPFEWMKATSAKRS